jgi:hypothetical protein
MLWLDLMRATESGRSPDWAAVVERLADPARFPAVARAVAAGIFVDDPDSPERYPDDEFDFGLHRILDGIEVLHRSRVSA